MSSKIVIVGDIHGCLDELQVLLDMVHLGAGDRLVLCGDLIDRGPDPVGVVRYLCEFRRGPDIFCSLVLGNHEEKALRWLRHHRSAKADSTYTNPMEDTDGRYSKLFDNLTFVEVQFLESATLWCPVPGGIVVHAGVVPSLTALPPEQSRFTDFKGKDRARFNSLVRARHVRDGEMVPLGEETPDDPYWADVYDGRFGHVWFGHNVFDQAFPKTFPHATGLDLGCAFGGHLAAVVIYEDGTVQDFSAKAKTEYAPRRLAAQEDP